MIDYMKPVGAFLENTVRPLISEMKWFIDELEKRGLRVTETSISHVFRILLKCYLECLWVNLIKSVIITVIVCLTAYMILV